MRPVLVERVRRRAEGRKRGLRRLVLEGAVGRGSEEVGIVKGGEDGIGLAGWTVARIAEVGIACSQNEQRCGDEIGDGEELRDWRVRVQNCRDGLSLLSHCWYCSVESLGVLVRICLACSVRCWLDCRSCVAGNYSGAGVMTIFNWIGDSPPIFVSFCRTHGVKLTR